MDLHVAIFYKATLGLILKSSIFFQKNCKFHGVGVLDENLSLCYLGFEIDV
jgi:hypothetical protein